MFFWWLAKSVTVCWEVLIHPLYLPDIKISVFHLLQSYKILLVEKIHFPERRLYKVPETVLGSEGNTFWEDKLWVAWKIAEGHGIKYEDAVQ